MQQCYHCGQLNEEYEDYCAYCGKPLFIEVDHGNDVKMDHLYADSIARELIDENTNIFEDDIDEIARELLSETKKEEHPINTDEYNFNTTDITDQRDEEIIWMEKELKTKLRRNKKLEAGMGLLIRNISIILEDKEGLLTIMGEITTNDKLDNKSVQLSAISYDKNKKILNKNNTIIQVDHGNFENFTISLDINIPETEIIIILPEMIRYDDNTESIEEKKEIKETQIPTEENNIFIEQLTDIERKIGMTISNTSILIKSENTIEIVGEIRIENPDKYHNIKITATCYDKNNKIIGTEKTQINTHLFLGFDTLSMKIKNINIENIERIRLYPTLQ